MSQVCRAACGGGRPRRARENCNPTPSTWGKDVPAARVARVARVERLVARVARVARPVARVARVAWPVATLATGLSNHLLKGC